ECIVHQNGETFNATSVSIPPVDDSNKVKLMVKEPTEDQGITLEFGQSTKEWSRYSQNYSPLGASTKKNKIIEVIEGQASGNCASGDFIWKITGAKKDAELYNTQQNQKYKIRLQKEETDVSFYDTVSTHYMCLNATSNNVITSDTKCNVGEGKTRLQLLTAYTLQFKQGVKGQLGKITAVDRTTFSIEGLNKKYTITFHPPSSVNDIDILGHITEEGNSQWRRTSPAAVSPGSTTDVTSENSKSHPGHCSNALLAGPNVGVIVLGILVAILFIALIFNCIYFKKNRPMSDKLHPMTESHTNGAIAEQGSGYVEMNENGEGNGTKQYPRISDMPSAMEEENDDIYDSADNMVDRKI
ncbi:unnamed protein product, partial [Meganyctiphanes norvegica]